MKDTKILLVDDHVLFREGVASLLDIQSDMTVLGEAASVKEAVVKARELRPDVILMDISLPDGTGVEAAQQILTKHPEIKIVFLTVHEDDERLFEAIKCGGQGYLLKNMRTAELLDLLRGLDRGEAAISRQMANRIIPRHEISAGVIYLVFRFDSMPDQIDICDGHGL